MRQSQFHDGLEDNIFQTWQNHEDRAQGSHELVFILRMDKRLMGEMRVVGIPRGRGEQAMQSFSGYDTVLTNHWI
jgi:hypothetical protein